MPKHGANKNYRGDRLYNYYMSMLDYCADPHNFMWDTRLVCLEFHDTDEIQSVINELLGV